MFIAIVIPTYQREDGKTPFYLRRTLDSVFTQTYKHFKVYLIGDHYEDEEELKKIVSCYPKYKIYFENLTHSVEREKYKDRKDILWTCGGTTASNYGIDKAKEEGLKYVCLLDHDDFWYPDHLAEIYSVILKQGADWVCTKTDSVGDCCLPKIKTREKYAKFLPLPCNVIKSSVCFNIETIPLRIINVFEITGTPYPGDAELWGRMAEYIKKYRLKSFMVNKITCIHDTERYSLGEEQVSTKVFSIDSRKEEEITVITCTGDRPETFSLLRRWMENQTNKPGQWIVVDDGKTPLEDTSGFEYYYRTPSDKDFAHTLCLNLLVALDKVRGDKILFMEDDDWYSPIYIEYMSQLLDKTDLAGLGNLVFYYPSLQKYMEKVTVKNPALAQTGIKFSLIPIVTEICEKASKIHDLNGKGLVDAELWSSDLRYFSNDERIIITETLKTASGRILNKGTVFMPPYPDSIRRRAEKRRGAEFANSRGITRGTKMTVNSNQYLSVGMKGLPGRKGLTTHHNKENTKYKKDVDGRLLQSILKLDAEHYAKFK